MVEYDNMEPLLLQILKGTRQYNLKNIELFGPESKKSNFVNHCEAYSKKEEWQRK